MSQPHGPGCVVRHDWGSTSSAKGKSTSRGLSPARTHPLQGRRRGAVEHGALFVAGSPLSLSATVNDDIVAGDHTIVVARINEVRVHDQGSPLVFHRSTMRRLEPN
jgi:flavin reductase (DIM6/NTAB) family NADH-FMN oxidoreductase RutF